MGTETTPFILFIATGSEIKIIKTPHGDGNLLLMSLFSIPYIY